MGGQMQHNNAAAAAAAHDHAGRGSLHNAGSASVDANDAVMARWLQSAGLQHLASPLASTGIDHRILPNLLMQGYGVQSFEEKQKIFKLLRNLNFSGEHGSDLYTPNGQMLGAASDALYSPELRGDLGAGLLDLHSMEDSELLSEHVMPEFFEPSPAVLKESDEDFDLMNRRQLKGQADSTSRSSISDKNSAAKESNLAKIKVVVRKRPLNKKELSRKEDDIVTVNDSAYLTVHEPKVKVDLTAYVEKHEFCFDAVLDEHVNNEEVYRVTIEPIIPTIFERTKATCFAYGQTGSGKTYTMKPLPIKAAEDIVRLLRHPAYRDQKFRLWLSYFEIYGGKLYDLLSDRRKLCMREDGRQQVCIVGLQEFEVSDVQLVKEFIEKGNAARSTGSTGANEESSRSHAILQLAIKKQKVVNESRRSNDGNESKSGKVIGKISFIDLAGSERGADTTDNDRQTRIEGAEINKSLLALKECIRALDNDQIHIPFRGSKLTEVLRDSFVGNSRTVMISCISPNAGSCEHTLNTLRYADRVKSLSKSGNAKKDQATGLTAKEFPLTSSALPAELDDLNGQTLEVTDAVRGVSESSCNTFVDVERNPVGRGITESLYNSSADERNRYCFPPSNYSFSGREENGATSIHAHKEKVDAKNSFGGSAHPRSSLSSENASDVLENDRMQKVPSLHRRVTKEEKLEMFSNRPKNDGGSNTTTGSLKQHIYDSNSNNVVQKQNEQELSFHDREINAILEEEEALISAHRKEIEETMEIVREEMKLLTEVDQPGSLIDNYVTQLSFVLSRKAAGLVTLQARLARFQHRLKEQELLSRKKVPR